MPRRTYGASRRKRVRECDPLFHRCSQCYGHVRQRCLPGGTSPWQFRVHLAAVETVPAPSSPYRSVPAHRSRETTIGRRTGTRSYRFAAGKMVREQPGDGYPAILALSLPPLNRPTTERAERTSRSPVTEDDEQERTLTLL
ncbi:hypothetical protein [Reticulibacter mediterranei]|uniref:hypothetical protein n=1 Tax=Reticulibacter mediterranei TaxID=2778369 RepID=UPI001C68D5BF|nr:hypothetical protein [Reticulibacter mediterranei]